MPPVSQPGSRAGLITALVIFVLGTFIGSIFGVYYYMELEKARKDADEEKKKREVVISDSEMTQPDFAMLKQARDGQTPKPTIYSLALEEKRKLAEQMLGQGAKVEQPAAEASQTIANAVKKAREDVSKSGVPVGGTSIPDIVDALAKAVIQKESQVNVLTAQLAAVQKEKQALIEQNNNAVQQHVTRAEAAEAARRKAVEDAAKERETKDAQIVSIQNDNKLAIEKGAEQVQKLVVDLQTANQQRDAIKKAHDKLQAILTRRRMPVREASIRHADGRIMQITPDKIVYINRGRFEQVSLGLTFEVYDANPGIPAMSEDADVMPQGKASIEVVEMGQNQSRCRVVRLNPGASLMEGDVIANLVYNPNTKFNFFVFPGAGFDLMQAGRPRATDAEVIKNLITRWGGNVTDKLDVNTDFVIFGQEWQMPKNIDPNDPVGQDIKKQIEAKQKNYDDILNLAKDLHVPILNQNRFLYYTGYYDTAKR